MAIISGNGIIYGTLDDDTITGGIGNDTFYGDEGNDVIYTSGSWDMSGNSPVFVTANDALYGGEGDDNLSAYASAHWDGNTYSYLPSGNTFLDGGNGADTLQTFCDGCDSLYGGDGNDYLSAFSASYTQGNSYFFVPSGHTLMDGGAGNDTIQASGGGDDTVYGGEGNDYLTAYSSSQWDGNSYSFVPSKNNLLDGGDGNDTLNISGGGNDSLFGGTGNDSIVVSTLTCGSGNSFLYLPSRNNYVNGGSGDDTLQTSGSNNDSLYGGEGNDYLTAYSSSQWDGNSYSYLPSENTLLDGGAGNDMLQTSGISNDSLYGGEGNDYLTANSSAQWYGNSYSYLPSGNTLMDGGAGNDTLNTNGGGNDSLYGGEGNDYLTANSSAQWYGNSYSYLPSGNTLMDGGDGNDTLNTSGGGNDSLYGGDGNDVITATNVWVWTGNDSYYTPSGNIFMNGGTGNDTLWGADGNDVLCGAGGNDQLSGGNGADTYVFSGSFGQDTIMADTRNAQDWLSFEGYSRTQIAAARVGNDLVLTLDAGNTVTIRGWDGSIDQFSFSDGIYALDTSGNWQSTEPVFQEGGEGNDILIGGFGNDTLRGGNGNDVLVGLGRNDVLSGGAGNDVYLYGFAVASNGTLSMPPIGNDTILAGPDNGYDRIVVDNVDGVNFNLYGNDMGLKVWDQAIRNPIGTIWLQDWMKVDDSQRIHQLTMRDSYRYFGIGNEPIDYYFDVDISGNGTLKSFAGNTENQMYYGAFGNDTILGGEGKDWLGGSLENDMIYGGNQDDDLFGGVGDDFLSGDAGNDLLRGGEGNDVLNGGAGNDVYRFGSSIDFFGENFGNDMIKADAANGGDVLQFRNMDLPQSVVQSGNDLVLHFVRSGNGAEWTITLQDWYVSEEVRIRNIRCTNTLDNPTDITLRLDVGTAADEAISHDGNGAGLLLYGLGGNDTLTGSTGNDYLVGGVGNDFLTGGVGNDTYNYGFAIPGGNGPMLTPAFGNDTIVAGSGNDVLIVDNIDAANPVQVGNDLILNVWDNGVNGSAGTITLQNWLGQAEADRIHNLVMRDGYRYYGSGNNPIHYYFDIDTTGAGTLRDFSGNSANQMYYGEGGNDTIIGGAGKDWLAGDADNDSISGGAGDDQLYGNIGDDWLAGGTGNDFLRGGSGSDTLAGGAGNDVYRFGSGKIGNVFYNAEVNGNDVIVADASNGNDLLLFRNTDLPDNAALVGNDLVIGYWNYAEDKDYTLTLQGWALGGGYSITQYQQNYNLDPAGYSENIRYTLGAGTNGDDTADFSGSYNMRFYFGFDGNDTYHGGNAKDRVLGGNDADLIYGGYGSDWLKGQSGDDMLYGEAENDMLQGGGGNDWLSGGNGVDTYRFGGGDETTLQENFGNDTIAGAADNFEDILLLRNMEGLQGVQQSGDDLRVDFINADRGGILNSITIQDWFRGPEYQIQTLNVMNGDSNQGNTTSTFLLQVGSNADDSVNFAGANAVLYFGLGGNDTVHGGNNADALFGGAGIDVLDGGAGADSLFGGAGNDRYVFSGSWGWDVICVDGMNPNASDAVTFEGLSHTQVAAGSSGNDLTLNFGGDNGVEIEDWFSGVNNKLNYFTFNDGNYMLNDSLNWVSMAGVTTLLGTAGNDSLDGSAFTTALEMYGQAGNDTLYGSSGSDYLDGGLGDDILMGGMGADTLAGGDGNDLLMAGSHSFSGGAASIWESLHLNIPNGFHWS